MNLKGVRFLLQNPIVPEKYGRLAGIDWEMKTCKLIDNNSHYIYIWSIFKKIIIIRIKFNSLGKRQEMKLFKEVGFFKIRAMV